MTTDASKPEAAKPVPTPPAKEPTAIEKEIETWFRDHFVESVLSGTTELWNLAQKAKDDLKARLAKL